MNVKRTKFHYTFSKTFSIATIYEDDKIICKDMLIEEETLDKIIDLLNARHEENGQLRQILKDIVGATDETYTKNTSMFKVTVVFDGKMYNQIKSCLK